MDEEDPVVKAIQKEALGYESKQDTRQRMTASGAVPAILPGALRISRFCPICGTNAPPVRSRKGSVVTMLFLLALGILPGILYAVIYNGYVWKCSGCGAKIADA